MLVIKLLQKDDAKCTHGSGHRVSCVPVPLRVLFMQGRGGVCMALQSAGDTLNKQFTRSRLQDLVLNCYQWQKDLSVCTTCYEGNARRFVRCTDPRRPIWPNWHNLKRSPFEDTSEKSCAFLKMQYNFPKTPIGLHLNRYVTNWM